MHNSGAQILALMQKEARDFLGGGMGAFSHDENGKTQLLPSLSSCFLCLIIIPSFWLKSPNLHSREKGTIA